MTGQFGPLINAMRVPLLQQPQPGPGPGKARHETHEVDAGCGVDSRQRRDLRLRFLRANTAHADLPEDMSTVSVVGGGLIAGDSLAALGLGIWGLLYTVI